MCSQSIDLLNKYITVLEREEAVNGIRKFIYKEKKKISERVTEHLKVELVHLIKTFK